MSFAHNKGRAEALTKQREREKEDFERQKQLLAKETELKVAAITNKFAARVDAVEDKLKSETVGLVTLDDFTARRARLELERAKQVAAAKLAAEEMEKSQNAVAPPKAKVVTGALSFNMDDEEEEGDGGAASEDGEDSEDSSSDEGDSNQATDEGAPIKRAAEETAEDAAKDRSKKLKLMKNPEVDTSFLPDRQREEAERQEREQLRAEWFDQQERIKNEEIDIVYSFWDGSGHRRVAKVKKGYSIAKFLDTVLDNLRKEFHELRTVSSDGLMYIKEDLIIPQHSTFYDFIVTKARGKSGPLFDFDVHDDIRMTHDASVEKQESHAGKVLLRSWYERNKHIFPANRWEPYDAEKTWDKYTIK
ncbi:hypothetical protein CAOG_00271 [Capsaspora owczarzaki ATCC 30864]|uniref:FAM50A/XAP5 C-terminal domain-containing protein n=1 Tax=Capsaspora owczarzaki (strain ATCC 30864) TaxID=595528 RepID=A0A0D2WIA0_CAPO3|nr:hypothetical protein CAOG_00271 [Capsaspora owczarzaki ATCC 30864]KJE88663.1 hypothetical protein CAOG_000271 [Capsaspora owczarzaki ATCC 30864]|eukprot:XP_004365142.1 hypothetical protein CAOG_00271 [Capsaspora owczarzaki ATCC 30864]